MGGKNSEYFCKLEKRNFVNKTITELIDFCGNHITDHEHILEEQVSFFSNLYKSRLELDSQAVHCEEMFLKHNVKLTDTQKESCEGILKLQECSEALRNMKNKKSPGSDGFTAEFYKFFWKDIGLFVCRSLNEGYQNGKLSQFQSQGIITCIPKEEKDRRYIKNWRPISLLNIDYKIGSSSIANRLKKVLTSIISDTQKGFIKGRFIGENTRFLYDLIEYLERQQKPGLLLLLDFEKAFDSLEWDFIKKALKSYNFGESIIKWFITLYSSSTSAVINNGNLSRFFNLERGCRQGDPLAPYIFILTVELLAISIKQNVNIKGITVKGRENKLGQYADDSFLTLDGTEKTLKESMSTIDKFGLISGLRLNISKSQAIWLGSKSGSDETLCEDLEIKWENKEFKLLGITFTKNLDDMVSCNYNSKIKSIKKLLASWMRRDLTPIGKITVIKTLALPKLIHLFSALPDPNKQLVDEINKIFFKFIWGYKVERLKRNTIVSNYDEGGLNMVHLSSFISYIKLKWVKRYLLDNEGTWQNMLHNTLNLKCVDFVFYLSKEKIGEFVHQIDNVFWKDVFRALVKVKKSPLEVSDYLQLDIRNFVDINKWNFYTEWVEKGIRTVNDLVTRNGTFKCYNDVKNVITGTNNFLNYYCIVSRIPKKIKRQISVFKNETNCEVLQSNECIVQKINCRSSIKFLYQVLKEKEFIAPTLKKDKWEIYLGEIISEKCWKFYYENASNCTKETKLIYFQYRILMCIVATNSFLHKLKLVENDLCTFCKSERETIPHIFYDCVHTIAFWGEFVKWYSAIENNYKISKKSVLLRNVEGSCLENFLILLAKKHIYYARSQGQKPKIQ